MAAGATGASRGVTSDNWVSCSKLDYELGRSLPCFPLIWHNSIKLMKEMHWQMFAWSLAKNPIFKIAYMWKILWSDAFDSKMTLFRLGQEVRSLTVDIEAICLDNYHFPPLPQLFDKICVWRWVIVSDCIHLCILFYNVRVGRWHAAMQRADTRV